MVFFMVFCGDYFAGGGIWFHNPGYIFSETLHWYHSLGQDKFPIMSVSIQLNHNFHHSLKSLARVKTRINFWDGEWMWYKVYFSCVYFMNTILSNIINLFCCHSAVVWIDLTVYCKLSYFKTTTNITIFCLIV